MDAVNASPSNTAHASPAPCRRAATARACGPAAAVRPSGLRSVTPSVGASPLAATAKYTRTWVTVLGLNPLDSSHGASIPF